MKPARSLGLTGALAGLLMLLGATGHAEVIYPKGVRVGLEPPPGMELDPQVSRFVDPKNNASITIVELPPQAYPDMEQKLFATSNTADVTVLKRESFPFSTGFGYFAAVRLVVNGTPYRKWALLLNAPGTAAVVSIEVPEANADAYPEATVRRALASVAVRDPPIEERLGLIPFAIADLSGFKVTEVAPTAVVLNDPDRPAGLPRVVVSVGRGGPEQPDDRARFARNLLENTPIPNLTVTSAEPLRIRGSPGFEVRGQARDVTGAEASVVQWVRFGSGGYLMVLGLAGKDQWESAYPRFRAIRDSVEAR